MSLNQALMNQYKKETGVEATYNSNGATYHFLGYVDWLEERAAKTLECANLQAHNRPITPCLECGAPLVPLMFCSNHKCSNAYQDYD